MLSKHLNEVIVFACEMPLEANILIESGSGKENLMLTSVSMTVGGVRGCPLRRGGGEQRSANQGDTSPTLKGVFYIET